MTGESINDMHQERKPGGSIRNRFILIVLLSSIPFFLAVTLSTYIFSRVSKKIIYGQIENATITVHSMIDSMLTVNVHAYLQSMVDSGVHLIMETLKETETSELPVQQRLQQTMNILSSYQIARSGYLYALDTRGVLLFHPDPNLQGTSQYDDPQFHRQLLLLNGYLEYSWQNTYEEAPQEKTLYQRYIPELGWILTATAYKKELTDMLDLDALRNTINSLSVGESGYSGIVDRTGKIIAHPYLEGGYLGDYFSEEERDKLMSHFFEKESGYATYHWTQTDSNKTGTKILYHKYLEDFDWVVFTTTYLDELTPHITTMAVINAFIALIAAVGLFFVVLKITRSIKGPIYHLMEVLQCSSTGDLSIRAETGGPEELDDLANHLNYFLEQLQKKTDSLSHSLGERDRLLHELQHRVKNNLQIFSSLLNLEKRKTENRETAEVIRDIKQRIDVLAVIYDYTTDIDTDRESGQVQVKDFVTEILMNLLLSFRIDSERVDITIDVNQEAALTKEVCLSFGFILNECLSKALRYLKSVNDKGNIAIHFERSSDNLLELDIRISTGQERTVCTTPLSNDLLDALAEQIHGIIEEQSGPGHFEFRVKFPE